MSLTKKFKEQIFNYLENNNTFSFSFFKSSIKNLPKEINISKESIIHLINLNENEFTFVLNGNKKLILELQNNNIFLKSIGEYVITNELKKITSFDFVKILFEEKTENIFKNIIFFDKEGENSQKYQERKPETKINFTNQLEDNRFLPDYAIINKLDETIHPFKDNYFFKFYSSKLAAEEFKRCVNLIKRRNNETEGNTLQTMELMKELMYLEYPFRKELEELAIKLIREMYNVPDDIDLQAMLKKESESCCESGECAKINISEERKKELYQEIEKRRILNTLVHGCSVYQWTSAYHQVRDKLNEFNPNFIDKYNLLSALVNYWNWKIYFEPFFEQGSMPVLQGINKCDIKNKKIEAVGMNFPVLIHELSKGVIDFIITKGLPKEVCGKTVTKDELEYIYSIADKYSHEQWHYFFGPTLWKSIITVANITTQELIPIISKMSLMNYEELSDFCIDIVFYPETLGKEKMDKLMNK